MSDSCWNSSCEGTLEALGFFEGTEVTTVEEMKFYEDDAEMVLVDRPFTVRVFLWKCNQCGQKVLTDYIGCGLDRVEGTPEEIKRRDGYERWVPGRL